MKRVTNRKWVDENGLIHYLLKRVLPDGSIASVTRTFPQPISSQHKAWCLRELRRDLREYAKPKAERWFRTDDSLPTSGFLVEVELFGGAVMKQSYSRGFWYYESGRISHHGRPIRWRYLPEVADA